MFSDYCPLVDDAWWHYYHNEHYALWQERTDRLIAALRTRAAKRTRDADAATFHALQEQLAFVDDVWDADMFELDV
jgi:hypothetical protein